MKIHSPNFLVRLDDKSEAEEKRALADYFVSRIVPGIRGHLFLAVGTTVYTIAEELFRHVSNIKLFTNCIPIAYRYLELARDKELAEGVVLQVVSGIVDQTTSVIATAARRTNRNATKALVWTPHGLSPKGLMGEHHIEVTKRLVAMHKRILMPVTYSKLGREGSEMIKFIGYLAKERKQNGRVYELILPPSMPSTFSQATQNVWTETLRSLAKHHVKIVNPPSFHK